MPEHLTTETVWLAYSIIVWVICAIIVLVPALLQLIAAWPTRRERALMRMARRNRRR